MSCVCIPLVGQTVEDSEVHLNQNPIRTSNQKQKKSLPAHNLLWTVPIIPAFFIASLQTLSSFL